MKQVKFYTPRDQFIEKVAADTIDLWSQSTKEFFLYGGYAIVESGQEDSPMITNNSALSAYI